MKLRTKIICTLGPATESEETIRALIEAGMDIARLNFSHNNHKSHGQEIDIIRKWSKNLNKEIKILCDLQGPKIRIGHFENPPIRLEAEDCIVLSTASLTETEPGEILIEDPYLHQDVRPGDAILIDDGQIELETVSVEKRKIYARVITGGDLYPKKGVNLPLTRTTTSSITKKDEADLKFALTKNPDWIAISFAQGKKDIIRVRELIGAHPAKIMCKIERAKAIENLNDLIAVSDGLMVARGDLGVEIPIERLPVIQKRIIRSCNDAGRPVVTATQMMASMTRAPFPTRAEVSDAANAVYDGTDAVMLSNETAVGQYPVEAVKMMKKVITETENYLFGKENLL